MAEWEQSTSVNRINSQKITSEKGWRVKGCGYNQNRYGGGARGVICGVTRGVMVIVVGNGHGNTSSNPGPG